MKKLLTLVAVAGLLSACTMPASKLGYGLITETKQTDLVTTNTGSKVGRACAKNYLTIVAIGDSSVEAAKKAGRITRVASVDTEIKNYVVIAEICTIVTGE